MTFWESIGLAAANLLTSMITAVTGVGGGMMLIGLLPLFLPAAAVVPVHGVTQLASNVSRAWFGRKEIAWRHCVPFLAGSLSGMLLFGWLVRRVSLEWVPLFIGVYILLIQWSPAFNRLIRRFESFFLVGDLQTGLSVFVGAPGPLNIAVLNKHYADNHIVVSTGAMMMTIVHAAKLAVYMAAGFAFSDYAPLLGMMVLMAALGSWLGTKLRRRFPMAWLKAVLPWLLTVLAVKLIAGMVWQQWLAAVFRFA